MNNFTVAKENISQTTIFISNGIYFLLAVMTIIPYILFQLPYSNILSVVYQLVAVCTITVLIMKRQALLLPALLLLSTGPARCAVSLLTNSEQAYMVLGNNYIIFALLTASVIIGLYKQNFKVHIYKWISYIFLVLLMGLSFFWAPAEVRITYYNLDFFCLIATYIAVSFCFEQEKNTHLTLLTFLFASLQITLFLLPSLILNGTFYEISAIGNRNYISLYIVICTVVTMTFLLEKWGFIPILIRIIGLLSVVGNVVIILSLASRTAFFMLILSVAIYALMNLKKQKKFFLTLLLVSISFLVVLQTDIAVFLFERLKYADMETGSSRTIIAQLVLDQYFNRNIFHLLFGKGYFSTHVNVNGFSLTTHNVYLSMLMHYGLVGLVLYLYTYMRAVLYTFRNKQSRFLLVALLMLLFYSFAIEIHIKTEFIILFSLCVSLYQPKKHGLGAIK